MLGWTTELFFFTWLSESCEPVQPVCRFYHSKLSVLIRQEFIHPIPWIKSKHVNGVLTLFLVLMEKAIDFFRCWWKKELRFLLRILILNIISQNRTNKWDKRIILCVRNYHICHLKGVRLV